MFCSYGIYQQFKTKIMDEIVRDVIVSIGAFAAIFGIIYVYLMTRHRERMAMLDRGIEISPFNSVKNSNFLTLKYGMLSVGVAIGMIMGSVLSDYGMAKSTSFLSMIFLFGGISLILNHIITRKIS